MTLADTDVLIDFLSGAEPMAGRVASMIAAHRVHTTVISRFELLAGARGTRQTAAIMDLLAAVPAVPLQDGEADRAASVRMALDRLGTPIGMADSLIAGITLVHGAVLLTRNRKHFERVAGLTLAASQ